MDALVDDKVTRLLYLWRDGDGGSIHAVEAVKAVCALHLCDHDEGCIADLIGRLADQK